MQFVKQLAAQATARQRKYIDPITGKRVTTKFGHLQRGKCCGSGCRHHSSRSSRRAIVQAGCPLQLPLERGDRLDPEPCGRSTFTGEEKVTQSRCAQPEWQLNDGGEKHQLQHLGREGTGEMRGGS
ncbi:hypothetical protein JZ751_025039, partial [Albula glossodonta]